MEDDLALVAMLERAIRVLCPGLANWEVRLANDHTNAKWAMLEAVTDVQYGNTAFFLFNPACGAGQREPMRYLAATVLHEVLHVSFYTVETCVERSFADDDNLGDVLDVSIHQLIDTLAWRLVDYVYPELFQQEEEKDEVSENHCVGDCGDVRDDHDCLCAD